MVIFPALPTIAVLATGGTIAGAAVQAGSVTNYRPGGIQGEALLAAIPGLHDIAHIHCQQVADVGSEDMTPSIWLTLVAAVQKAVLRPDINAVVITHGTDTMEETAVLLDLTLPLGKPIILTGAMRPADAISADGPANILGAIRTATAPDAAKRGVLVVMNDRIHRARHVAKADTLALDAFKSPQGEEGRLVDSSVLFHHPAATVQPPQFPLPRLEELPRVEIIYGHAGQESTLIDAAITAGAQGIVHAGVGMGNIHAAVRPKLAEAAASGIVVVYASRVASGPVPVTAQNRRDGLVSASTLSPHKARVVLQLALTQTGAARDIQRIFLQYH